MNGVTKTAVRSPPFRAEHIGSLLRLPELFEMRKSQMEGNTIPREEEKAIEDRAVRQIIGVQQKIGLRAINDGEYRRDLFIGPFYSGLEGFENVKDLPVETFRQYLPDTADFLRRGEELTDRLICTGKIKHVGSHYTEEFNTNKQFVDPERHHEIKISLTSPYWYHYRYRAGMAYPKGVYKSDDEYFVDLVAAYRKELEILYENGCRNVQIDDPYLTSFCSVPVLAGFKEEGVDADALLDRYIQVYKDCLRDRPADFHIGIHLCRGNFAGSRHFTVGSYDRIAIKLFNEVPVNTYYLEYDTSRAGGFEPLKHLPKHKNVILGVITSKSPELENLEKLKARVHQAAAFMAEGTGESPEQALHRMGVSPQCGFASHFLGNSLSFDDMVEKLKLVRRLADEIWAEP
ncbi:Methionine synthase vitamin-B12 independent [Neofusicoccum parvum]|nr:Methionine synthase vitamin-B12 independent [Neofusicoccum parvum]